jgi:acetyl-CoA carboxylase alpha subunit
MIDIIKRPRRTGRTEELIRKASASMGQIVCHSYREADRIVKVAETLGVCIMYPINYDEFILRAWQLNDTVTGFYIDNADDLLQYIAGHVPVISMVVAGEV